MKQKRAILWIAVSSGIQATEEKDSLPEQERQLREVAEKNKWQIIDIITVPGHSRIYYNYPEFAAAALGEDIPDPVRMLEHWKRRDFDIFACMSGDRFGRAASIFNEVVERTYDAGAQVYTMRDGMIERGNEGTWAVMASYAASSEPKELRRRHKFGMNQRAKLGLPVSPRLAFSHTVVRDKLGKAQQIIVREEYRRLFTDLARALLDRTAWIALEKVLYEQYGHVAENGKPYPPQFFYRVLNSPTFWGHNARYYADRKSEKSRIIGSWMFDDSDPAPEGVLIYYNTHEPMYTGKLADEVKAELRRRLSLRGGARPNSQYALSKLFECKECGRGLSWTTGRNGIRRARCNLAYGLLPRSERKCIQRKYLPEAYALDYVQTLVNLLVQAEDPRTLLNSMSEEAQPIDETPMLVQELEDLEEQGRVLIQLRMKAQGKMITLYEEQETLLNQRMEAVQTRLHLAQRLKPSPFEIHDQVSAIDEIRKRGAKFWQLPPGQINQVLRRALQGHMLRVFEGKIRGLKYRN